MPAAGGTAASTIMFAAAGRFMFLHWILSLRTKTLLMRSAYGERCSLRYRWHSPTVKSALAPSPATPGALKRRCRQSQLNRTVVGFSHGKQRLWLAILSCSFQTPPIDGNLAALFRDLLYGGRSPEYYLRNRRLENGPRECIAVVVMPSFIQHVTLDIASNWFKTRQP